MVLVVVEFVVDNLKVAVVVVLNRLDHFDCNTMNHNKLDDNEDDDEMMMN